MGHRHMYYVVLTPNNNLLWLGNPGMGKRVVYGCTQLSGADHFLDQLVQLGTEV